MNHEALKRAIDRQAMVAARLVGMLSVLVDSLPEYARPQCREVLAEYENARQAERDAIDAAPSLEVLR